MRTCSNASRETLLDDRRTRMMVGLGGTAATVDIDTLAWKKNKDQREEAGQEDSPPDIREQINVERSGEQLSHSCLLFDGPCLCFVPRRY
jgi:hypothetical protein